MIITIRSVVVPRPSTLVRDYVIIGLPAERDGRLPAVGLRESLWGNRYDEIEGGEMKEAKHEISTLGTVRQFLRVGT